MAPADDTPAIEAEGLTRRFGDFVAVDHVSFRIGRGEIFGFLGSNGCGKTTTMKMLTGLLPVTEGTAKLFGTPMGADDMEARWNVGYMSQAFSLYGELTVRQNIELHARLYHIPSKEIGARIEELLKRFDLEDVPNSKPESLPLGQKQLLQLAVAVLHKPSILILDEPTSGVDPVARDQFWRTLIDLSRNDGVTIFLSTHFMNEGERCDRISLMHRGKVLAVGAPKELVTDRGCKSLEDAFISYLEEAAAAEEQKESRAKPRPSQTAAPTPAPASPSAEARTEAAEARTAAPGTYKRFDPRRLWAYTRRETLEILRDPVRLSFAFLGPVILMFAMGFDITFDVENLKFAAFDQDQTPESRRLLETFSGSRYFTEQPQIRSATDLERRMRSGELAVAVEIPAGFGRDLQNLRPPEIAFYIDSAMPFRGETTAGYITGLALHFARDFVTERLGPNTVSNVYLGGLNLENRFRYNQGFKSVYSMVPSVIMIMLMLIPAIMSTTAIVREKEMGSIANFRSTPITKLEFLIGKQIPYILVGMLIFVVLLLMSYLVFHVPVTGSFGALSVGALLYVIATTGFGQLVSTFTRTQVAALFACTVISVIPTLNFSGLLVPVASLSGAARLGGLGFKRAVEIPSTDIDSSMESQRFVFVIEIPPRFEKDVLAGRQPSVQINVDATAVSQAFNGMTYIQNVIVNYVSEFVTGREGLVGIPIKATTRVMFNPNQYSLWFTAVMQVLSNLTMLAVILTGAALIREREQGTVEHLLVMPVIPVEIMLSKILANAIIILGAAALAMKFVVEGWLDVPVAGSRLLFFAGSCIFVITVGSLGIALGTIASTMGQFGLLQIPVLLVLMLLSGATTPMESMPVWLQYIMKTISPMPHFVEFAKNVLFRGADLPIVWPQMAAVAALGAVYFGFTLVRFRRVIFASG